jgi:hypothetical protein
MINMYAIITLLNEHKIEMAINGKRNFARKSILTQHLPFFLEGEFAHS